jgi:hypothetical protein
VEKLILILAYVVLAGNIIIDMNHMYAAYYQKAFESLNVT